MVHCLPAGDRDPRMNSNFTIAAAPRVDANPHASRLRTYTGSKKACPKPATRVALCSNETGELSTCHICSQNDRRTEIKSCEKSDGKAKGRVFNPAVDRIPTPAVPK